MLPITQPLLPVMKKSAARDAQSSPSSSSSFVSAPVPSQKRKAGRKKFRETRHPVYRGVRQRNGKRWVCEVREPNTKSRIWLGTFATPEMAAAAYDVAALALRGESASLNFPDAAARLPRAKSSSAVDIQVAALEAATALRAPDDASSWWVKLLETSTSGSESVRNVREGSKDIFVDEEALFDMPGLVRSMAEGLLLAPPTMFGSDDDAAAAASYYSTHFSYFSLWNI